MIARIEGTLESRGEGYLLVSCNGITYQIQVPPLVHAAFEAAPTGQIVQLETVHYFALEQTRATPVLLGFENTLEKEFFEKLLTVPKMGPKGALGLLTQPVSVIAGAVENADNKFLESLPGVGKQRARDMIATLQGKLARFALLQDGGAIAGTAPVSISDVGQEALQILLALGHKRADAERMTQEALATAPDCPDAESLVRVVYKKQQEKR
jgi:Holliday junction DNA helicase RuvA